MSTNSLIQWTDVTDNIIVAVIGGWWCRMKNLLCTNCYAQDFNQNTFFGGNQLKYTGQPPELKLRRELIQSWARQRKPKKHFVASMTDVFGEWVPRAWQFEFLDGMVAASRQIFQVLTKRTRVCQTSVKFWMAARGHTRPPQNIWLGFSAGNQETFDEAWADMKQLAERGFVVFASLEPMLGAIELPDDFLACGARVQVITGGESGKRARPAHPRWFRDLRDQCHQAGVPFFFKQWGEHADVGDYLVRREGTRTTVRIDPAVKFMHVSGRVVDELPGTFRPFEWAAIKRVGKDHAGRLLDGREWNEMPGVNVR